MAELKKQVSISEDFDGTVTARLVEYDKTGKLIDQKEKQVDESAYKGNEDYLTDVYEGYETSEQVAIRQAGGADTPEGAALAAQAGQNANDVQLPNLMSIYTDGHGHTLAIDAQGKVTNPGGPIKSGDVNVADEARKREDGAAEPKLEAIDLNAPSEPIRNAPRGGAVTESQSPPEFEVDKDPGEDDEDDTSAVAPAPEDDGEDDLLTKEDLEAQDEVATETGLAGGEPQTEGGTKVLPQNKGAEPGDEIEAGAGPQTVEVK